MISISKKSVKRGIIDLFMPSVTRIIIPTIIVALIIALFAVVTKDRSGPTADAPKQGTVQAPQPTKIPASKPEAKTYIDRAAEAAQNGDYDTAISITQEAIIQFPDDTNLKLNLDFYQMMKLRNATP